jgi:hypothetical protein
MSGYATLLALEREYGVKMYLRPDVSQLLRKYFPGGKFPNVEDDYPDWQQKSWATLWP